MGEFSGGKDLLFSANDVIEFIKTKVSFSGHFNSGHNITYPHTWREELFDLFEKKIEEAEKRERTALWSFGVDSIAELQERVKEAHNLFAAFSNDALKKVNPKFYNESPSSLNPTVIAQALKDALLDENGKFGREFKQIYLEKKSEEAVDFLLSKIVDTSNVTRGLAKTRGENSRNVRVSALKGRLADLVKYINGDKKRIKSLGEYKKEIILNFDLGEKLTQKDELTLSLYGGHKRQKNTELFSYPYYRLSEEDEKTVLMDRDVWEDFKKNLRASVATELGRQTFDAVIDKFYSETSGAEFFKAYTYNQIIGNLGELQAALIIAYIYGGPDSRKNLNIDISPVGNVKGRSIATDSLNKKTPVDIIVSLMNANKTKKYSYGIQVKNIASWPLKEDGGKHGFTLKGDTKTLSNYDKKNLQDFVNILVTYYFNQPVKDSSELYRNFYNGVFGNGTSGSDIIALLNAIGAANFGNFFGNQAELKDFRKCVKQQFINPLQKYVYNAFYLFQGKYIIGYSQIYSLIYNRLIKSVEQNEEWLNFYIQPMTRSSYNGPKWEWKYSSYGQGKTDEHPDVSREDIMGKINFHATLNFYVSDLIGEKAMKKLGKNNTTYFSE